MIVRQRIPADIVAEREVEGYERGPPPTAVTRVSVARRPGPVVINIDPTAVVIRRPSPWLVSDPRPPVRRTPGPTTVTIRCPISVAADHRCMRTPDPAVLVSLGPIAIGFELFRAPRRFIEIPDIVLVSLGQVLFATADPGIDRVARRGGDEFPVAGVIAGDNQFRRTPVAQSKSRGVGINPRGAAIAHGQTDAAVARHVDSIKSLFLGGHGCLRRVDFEVTVFGVIKLREPDGGCSFNHADRDAFVAEGDDAQH